MPPKNPPSTDKVAGTSSNHKLPTEKLLPRVLSNGADPGKPNGTPRNEAASYYGTSPAHPFSSSSYVPTNDNVYNAPVLGPGAPGNYSPPFQPAYASPGMAYTPPASVPFVPGTSSYNPTPVPQVSPFHIGPAGTPHAVLAAPAAPAVLVAPGDSHTFEGESASYYGAPQTGTSVTSSAGSAVHNQHVSSGFGQSLESTITGITNVVQGHPHSHNQNHNGPPPPPLRQSVRKLWENIRAEERYAIGQYEIYSEFIGVCSGCFDPESSPVEAPRTHHYGQRLTKKGWRTKRKSSRRVWFFRRRSSGVSSPSNGSSSSSSGSTASASDSDMSDTTRKRVLEKRIRREEKELTCREQRAQEGKTGAGSSRLLSSGSSGSHIKTSVLSHSATGVLRGGDLDKSKPSDTCYDPGYGPDGQAHPGYYGTASAYEKKQVSKSSGVLGGFFGSSSRNQKHKRTSSQVSRNSGSTSPRTQPLQFSTGPSGEAANNDALVYGRYSSSPSSIGSNKGWFFKSGKKDKVDKGKKVKAQGKKKEDGKSKNNGKRSSSSSASSSGSISSPPPDGLAYGRVYDSRRGTSIDSASVKSKRSYVGSISESLKSVGSSGFEVTKMQRRKSWDDYGTPGPPGRSGSAAVGFSTSRRSSTGGSKTLVGASSTSPVSSPAATNSSWWGGKARKSDGYALQTGNGTRPVAAPAPGRWFPGGGRKSGGWFGGSGAGRTTRSVSVSSVEGGVGAGDNFREQYVFSNTTGGGVTRHSGSEASTPGAKSLYSSTDLINIRRGKESETFMQRQNSESRVFASTSAVRDKEVWIRDPIRRERSPDRSSITTAGSQRRASSADSWGSESRQAQFQESLAQKSVSTTTTRTGFMGLFSGRSEGGRKEESKSSSSRESVRKSVKTEESKGSKKDAILSTTSVAVTSKEEKPTKLQTVYPMVCRSSAVGSY